MFKTTKEFNKCWRDFLEKHKRNNPDLRVWFKKEGQMPHPYYLETKVFKYCVETFNLWKEFKKTLNPDDIPNSYAYKTKWEWEQEKKQIKEDRIRDKQLEFI